MFHSPSPSPTSHPTTAFKLKGLSRSTSAIESFLGSSYSSFPSPTRTLLNTTANNSNNGLLSSPITLPLHQDILLRGKPVLSPIRSLAIASDRSRDQSVDDLGKLHHSPSSWKKLHATITIRRKHTSSSSNSSNNNILAPLLDGAASLQGLFGQSMLQDLEAGLASSGLNKITLQLISQEIDPRTGKGKQSGEATLKDWASKVRYTADKVAYTAEFMVPPDFGRPGAISILNQHSDEFYLETISLEGGQIYFPCYSWVQSRLDSPEKRIFFSNDAYLPGHTPDGLSDLRAQELASIRGDGRGQKKKHERVYDYAVYNDLGNPDKHESLSRPPIGGSPDQLPYPRRMRTGRAPTKRDPASESPLGRFSYYYVPRDEAFEDLKKESYVAGTLKVLMHELLPQIESALTKENEFNCFTDIDRLYKESVTIEARQPDDALSKVFKAVLPGLDSMYKRIPRFLETLEDSINLRFSPPHSYAKDKYAWMRDDEFGRQALAGVNPIQIELMKSFPPTSNLDPNVYGPKESAIKEEHISEYLQGLSVQQAIDEKRLFIIDYHDVYLPFVNKINEMKDRKLYASRTIFFLTDIGTLTPVAIELSLPPSSSTSQGSKRVFTPGQDATGHWFWQLAKAHAASNDVGFHQLVNHWLRSHAVVEPYVIATHRRLSSLHPISKLLQPHLRYTLEINALARQLLIGADGVIEQCFTPGKYSMEMSSAAYKSMWRFDMENLPADLLRRGMAVADSNEPGGLKLVIEDYPYATDGLLIWRAIQDWVTEYVNIYYGGDEHGHALADDTEIHEWWEEIKHCGHADKSHESWWPELKTKEDLISILSNIIWITSAHHAAVNFGQYPYGGYVPNRPAMTRRLIPDQDENNPEYQEFKRNPQKFFLSMLPNKFQTAYVMSVLDSLSTHASDEEYLGDRVHTKWTSDARVIDASKEFSTRVKLVEEVIDQRNVDPRLKNRNGAGVLGYELLRPSSTPGVTARGIPNSISI